MFYQNKRQPLFILNGNKKATKTNSYFNKSTLELTILEEFQLKINKKCLAIREIAA